MRPAERAKIGRDLDHVSEKFYNTPRAYGKYDAQKIAEHFMDASLKERHIDVFLQVCVQYSKVDLYQAEQADVENMLQDLFKKLDNLFFFGLLTRRVFNPISKNKEPLVSLTVGTYPPDKTRGQYSKDPKPMIQIFALDPKGRPNRPFWSMLHTIAHELCHAYQDIFTDRNTHYDKSFLQNDTHGEWFWEMLHFIYLQLSQRTQEEGIRRYLETICEEAKALGCYRLPEYLNYNTLLTSNNS
ncbi:hypothetical protein GGR57DRAFT_504967 [Xylariaceae sp. FL1272]|nr:hypothetical protein GGR57DRAFT_504967 [Xylariaceae sp. FL1272]